MKIDSKKLKIIKIISIVLLVILVGELIYFGYKYYKRRKETTYYTITNELVLNDDNYIGVGLSDFKNSKFNDSTKYNKATIWEYDSNFKVLQEKFIDLGYNSYFNSIIKIDDGYVAVGAIEMTSTQHDESVTEGLIVRYDNDLNIVWRKNTQVLDDTELIKVKLDKEGNLVIVGQSIYAKNIIGNHSTGGAMLFKYNLDGEEMFRLNYGGPQTGSFNDVVIEDDGYVVVGVTKTGTGIIQKYNFKGKEVWHNYYGLTNSKGLTKITKYNDNYYVLGTLIEDKTNTSEYKASIIKFDSKGNKKDSITYEKEKLNEFTDIYIENNYIYVVGSTGKYVDDKVITDGLYLKYDTSLKLIDEKVVSLSNSFAYSKIYKNNDKFELLGFTNSKSKKYNSNGYDYYPLLDEY